MYGAITVYDDDKSGCDSGDGFVEAPDGARAGLDWIVGKNPGRLRLVWRGDKDEWAIYEATFARPIFSTADLTREFRAILPAVKRKYWRLKTPRNPVARAKAYPRGQYGWPVVPLSHFRRKIDYWRRYVKTHQGIFVTGATEEELAVVRPDLVDHEVARCVGNMRLGKPRAAS
ncbi:MAG: hypothetical protein KIT44_11415 [Opitutaceae bacterium]|nr:hypothetical protein [Opitutaceae bacterium]